jgi:hypothetical protein
LTKKEPKTVTRRERVVYITTNKIQKIKASIHSFIQYKIGLKKTLAIFSIFPITQNEKNTRNFQFETLKVFNTLKQTVFERESES